MGKLYDLVQSYLENPQEKADLLPEITKSVQELEASEAVLTDKVSKLYESNLNLAKMVSIPPEPKKEEPKEQAEPPKMGQPKKYDEPTKHVSFSLPVSVIENLKILAGLRKTNQTQLVLGMINRELETEAEKIKAYKELLK